jgi:hypothetical protein
MGRTRQLPMPRIKEHVRVLQPHHRRLNDAVTLFTCDSSLTSGLTGCEQMALKTQTARNRAVQCRPIVRHVKVHCLANLG